MTNETQEPASDRRRRSISGVLYAAGAFVIWGLSPAYWKALQAVPAIEIVSHRVVWSFLFLVGLTVIQRRVPEVVAAARSGRTLLILSVTTLLVSANWLLYIWAVNAGFLLQASLGYYINPLVNVLLGVMFLRERLRRPQAIAVFLALAAVLVRTASLGQFPWIALSLGFSFGVYGLIRKVTSVGSLAGLTVETMLLTPVALAALIHFEHSGAAGLFHGGTVQDVLLLGTGVITAVPLLFFNLGARRINLSTVGLLQYIAPTFMFLMAVLVYAEPFSIAQLLTFALIWSALAIYSLDSVRSYRRTA